ncbi:MAG: hypothetical protein JSR81_03270 [Proteobacteria bacterium]|nr:hypothetical protein [Pseudomonadota bacterium]
MSKYDALGQFLRTQKTDVVPMTFAEIEQVTGAKLPASRRYPAWWSNYPLNNVMTRIWLDAGFRTEQVDIEGQKLVFRRVEGARMSQAKEESGSKRGQGMSDVSQQFKPAEQGEKKPKRSPLWGALKGTFTIEPGWDITKPALDPEELADWEASLDRKADLYEKGLTRKS